MVLCLFVIMLVNVGAEEKGREEIFNKQRQVTASLIFCFLLVAGVLYAVNNGYRGLQKDKPPPEQLIEQQAVRDEAHPVSGTQVSRITDDTARIGSSLY